MREVRFQIKILLPEFIYRLCIFIVLHYRKLRYGFPFRKIPLTKGQFAIVDNIDYEMLAGYKWCALRKGRTFYAERRYETERGVWKQRHISMHRQILDEPAGLCVDHINHNGLDNRRANLRIVTLEQNNWNSRKCRGNFSSQYKGVSWSNRCGKWLAKIVYKGKSIYIGYFDDEVSAARAYDAKAKEMFGEYAELNFGKGRGALELRSNVFLA